MLARLANDRDGNRIPLQLGWIPQPVREMIARYRRRKGLYDGTTASLFSCEDDAAVGPRSLLARLRFERDLGGLLSRNDARELSSVVAQMSLANWRHAMHLLLECNGPERMWGNASMQKLRRVATQSPVLASLFCNENKTPESSVRELARLHNSQQSWRAEFSEWVAADSRTICVVGNANTLAGSGMGSWIDSHDIVVRFNKYHCSGRNLTDVGSKTDIWVQAPDLDSSLSPSGQAPLWVILTGPDVRYHMKDWSDVVPLLSDSRRILFVPLAVWRALVVSLQAPPTAGVLTLNWLQELTGSLVGVHAVGFQDLSRIEQTSAPSPKGGARHNWQAEAQLLAGWRDNGLNVTNAVPTRVPLSQSS